MAWSITAIGRPAAVASKAITDLASFNCPEPEQAIKDAAQSVIVAAIQAQTDPSCVIRVYAGGRQDPVPGPNGAPSGAVRNTLLIQIEPLIGFVE